MTLGQQRQAAYDKLVQKRHAKMDAKVVAAYYADQRRRAKKAELLAAAA